MCDAKLLREILDAQSEMLCRFGRDGTILFVNRAYAETIASTPDELIGRSLWDFVTPQDRAHVEAQIAKLSPEQPFLRIENRFETASGPRWTMWRNLAVSFDSEGRWLVAQSTGVDITLRKQLEEQRQLLIDELNHRVRNTLMVVQGLAHQTFRRSELPAPTLAAFNARLHALAAAHTALSGSNWSGAAVDDVVVRGLAFCGEDIERVSRDGPGVNLRPNVTVALVLVLHELATNAVKYGALSNEWGRIAVAWHLDDERSGSGEGPATLRIAWAERDGPRVAPPTHQGFGSRLVTTSIERQLGGTVDLDFAPDGLICRMAIPLNESVAA